MKKYVRKHKRFVKKYDKKVTNAFIKYNNSTNNHYEIDSVEIVFIPIIDYRRFKDVSKIDTSSVLCYFNSKLLFWNAFVMYNDKMIGYVRTSGYQKYKKFTYVENNLIKTQYFINNIKSNYCFEVFSLSNYYFYVDDNKIKMFNINNNKTHNHVYYSVLKLNPFFRLKK